MNTMAMNSKTIPSSQASRKPAPLAYFLGFIFTLFIAILIFCYVVTKRTPLIYLNENGKPVSASAGHSHH